MRILLCIFSGTGNTRKVGAFFADVLRGLGHEADVALIREDVPMPAIEGYDTLVIGYPVHAFNAPKPVLAFLKRLPKAQKPVYLLRTSGEPSKINDASGISPKRILKKKGYDVRGEFSYVMPYNIIFRHSDKMAIRMWKAALCKIPKDAALLAEGGTSLRKVGPLRRTAAAVVRIEHPAMPILGRTFRVNRKKCVGCASCVAACPLGNITMKNGIPKFGGHCVGCMACAFGCPEDAVRISLLNLWRVNGQYSFEGEPAADEEVCRYCRKMYLNYFHTAEDGEQPFGSNLEKGKGK